MSPVVYRIPTPLSTQGHKSAGLSLLWWFIIFSFCTKWVPLVYTYFCHLRKMLSWRHFLPQLQSYLFAPLWSKTWNLLSPSLLMYFTSLYIFSIYSVLSPIAPIISSKQYNLLIFIKVFYLLSVPLFWNVRSTMVGTFVCLFSEVSQRPRTIPGT